MALTVGESGSRVEKPAAKPVESKSKPEAAATKPAATPQPTPTPAPAPTPDAFSTKTATPQPPVQLDATPTPGAPQHGNPDINVDGGKGATYQTIPGQPFIQGAGDANAVHPNDVSQGGIGDCYFMSSLATIAQQKPDLIQNMIKKNDDGTYTVTLYEKRPWYKPFGPEFTKKEITVTADLPVRNGNPVFAQTGDANGDQRELWVGLIEKAYAQEHGSYKSIVGGYGSDAMEEIAGKSSDTYSPGKITIQQLADMHQKGLGITVSSAADYKLGPIDLPDTVSKDPLYKNGTLVANHEYWVSNVDVANNKVELRNPWGYEPPVTLTMEEFQRTFRQVSTNPLN